MIKILIWFIGVSSAQQSSGRPARLCAVQIAGRLRANHSKCVGVTLWTVTQATSLSWSGKRVRDNFDALVRHQYFAALLAALLKRQLIQLPPSVQCRKFKPFCHLEQRWRRRQSIWKKKLNEPPYAAHTLDSTMTNIAEQITCLFMLQNEFATCPWAY